MRTFPTSRKGMGDMSILLTTTFSEDFRRFRFLKTNKNLDFLSFFSPMQYLYEYFFTRILNSLFLAGL